MTGSRRRSVPAWRVSEAHPIRWHWACGAVVLVGVLLLEVWQYSTVDSLSEQVGRATHRLQQASAELEWMRAQLDRESSRSALTPLAAELGLHPADPQQIVPLGGDFPQAPEAGRAPAPGMLAFADRALHALVPDAAARGRTVN